MQPGDLDDLSRWARGDGLEIVLLAIGAVLLTRFLHWGSVRLIGRLELHPVELGAVPSERDKYASALLQTADRFLAALCWFFVAVLILLRLNIPMNALLAPTAALGVALGIGGQRIVGDLLAGFFLISERQYGVGDDIQVGVPGQIGGVSGTVESVTLRVTRVRTLSGDVIAIANGEIRQLVNRSRGWSRIIVDIPVPATEDLDRIAEIFAEVGRAMMADGRWRALLLAEPELLGVERVALDHVELRVAARTLPGRQWDVGRELRRRSVQALRGAGIFEASA